jgi:mediator of RNA polymerase II transcription subunit 13
VHGDSTVCASMDIREHPPVRHLTEEDLSNVIKTSEQNADSCTLDGSEQKDEINITNKAYMQSVILAPFGLSAVLSGSKNSENIDQNAEKIINDWNTFYPMKKLDSDTSSSKLPLLVEVISGMSKTCYKSRDNKSH